MMLTRRSESGTWVAMSDPDNGTLAAGCTDVEGERRLLVAVLAQALRSLFTDAGRPGRGAARRLRQDLTWLTSHDREEVFAFERICEMLNIDADRLRDRVVAEIGDRTAMLIMQTAPRAPRRRGGFRIPPPPFVESFAHAG